MQIDGTREFFSRIAALTTPQGPAAGAQSNPLAAIFPALQGIKSDTLNLSDIGKRLSFGTEKAPLLSGNQADGITDPLLRMTNKSMSQAKDILERMHELATRAAEDKNLTDLERVEMQIEFEELRKDLTLVTVNMLRQYHGGSPVARRPDSYSPHLPDVRIDIFGPPQGDGSTMLDRMRSRIANGQEWNVREVWRPHDSQWDVVDDNTATILTWENGSYVDSGNKVPTVRERLEWETPVILMDAKSAADGAKRIEQEIGKVQKWLDTIAKADPEQSVRIFWDAWGYLDNNPLLGGIVADSTKGVFFLHGNKVHDAPYMRLGEPQGLPPRYLFFHENKPHVVERLTEAKIALAKMEPKIAHAS